jgi:hypothetical protein
VQDEKHLLSSKVHSPHCDLQVCRKPGYISNAHKVHLWEEQMRNTAISIVAAAAGLAVLALPCAADTVTFKAPLSASEEVPPTQSKGTGNIEATYDTSSKKLSWKGSYSGLTGPVTAAHFHGPAEKGKNAGVVVPVDAAKSPFEGSATLTDPQAADLQKGDWYFNIHTAENKGGEIRGQLVKAT